MAVATDEHLIVYVPDHDVRAAALLLRQWRDTTRIEGFVRALGAGVQLAELTAWAVIAGGGIDAAEGATLDRWGTLVGEPRGGLDHEQYRAFIELRARVNSLFPNEDMLYGLLADATALYFGEVTRYLVSDGMVWSIYTPAPLPDAVSAHTGWLMRDARPAAIYMPVIVWDDASFTWDSLWDGPDVWAELIYDGRGRA